MGRPALHLLRSRGLRAVSRGRACRPKRGRAREGDARDPEARDIREVLARRAYPAPPTLAGAQRGTLSRRHRVRILVVVQRYGAEVVGGSESHARVVAHRLAMVNEVEVATTNALDYWSWAPYFAAGESMDGPVRVRRFAVTGLRSTTFKESERHILFEPHTLADEQGWLAMQGPHTPELLEVLGIGLDAPPWHDPEPFRDHYAPRGPLVVYLGQVSEGKAVDELLADWIAYRESGGAGSLVLAGTARMPIPERDDIVALGRVSDEEKYALLEAADALVLPSHLESLGIVLLEAWQVGTPCLVSAKN